MTRWVFLHHRGASLFLRQWFKDQAEAAGWTVSPTLAMAPRPLTPQELLDLGTYDLVIDGQARPDTVSALDEAYGEAWCGVHVPRDPHTLLLSAYYSHLHSHPVGLLPGLESHRRRLEVLSLEWGLRQELEFYVTQQAIEAVLEWPYQHPRILDVPFEVLFPHGTGLLQGMLKWLGLPATEHLVTPEADWEIVAGRVPGDVNVESHYTGGSQAFRLPPSVLFRLPPSVRDVLHQRYGYALTRVGYPDPLEGA